MTGVRFRCDECGWIGDESEIITAPNPFEALEVVSGCPRCKAVDQFTNTCDEPGCDKDAGCGWPTKDGGYRRTCYEHSNNGKEKST